MDSVSTRDKLFDVADLTSKGLMSTPSDLAYIDDLIEIFQTTTRVITEAVDAGRGGCDPRRECGGSERAG